MEYKNVRVCRWGRCDSLGTLRDFLCTKVPSVKVNGETPNFANVDIGYIEPGHGSKGKKQWLIRDDDVQDMYKKHEGKYRILLWAYSSNLTKNKGGKEVSSSFAKHKENLSEVDKTYDELRKKHGIKYSLDQLRMWAQMIHLGSHDSLDEPPDKPYWTGRKHHHDRKRQCVETAPAASPSKRSKVSVRSELLDQLEKWHKLSEAGVVDDVEYEDLKKNILSDIKQL